jgi:hypothetical protein
MPVIIEDVVVQNLMMEPPLIGTQKIFNQDTKLTFPDWIPITVGMTQAQVGLARVVAIDETLRVDAAIYDSDVKFLGAHGLRILGTMRAYEEINGIYYVKRFDIENLLLHVYPYSDPYSTPRLASYVWTCPIMKTG